MKFGLIPVNIGIADPDRVVALAQAAERAGFESAWTFEHVMVPLEYASKYPYNADGKMGLPPETPFLDPLIALTWIAAATERLRLGTGVNILPQVSPLLLAKQAASLDVVSEGRFMLGLGIGWLREEFHAMNVPFERRGARFDDYLAGMRKVWSGEVVEHKGEFLDWSGFKSHPRPVQDPLPVVIGGNKGKAFERVARFGQGWYAPTFAPDPLAAGLDQLREACRAEGRDPDEIEVTTTWLPAMGTDLALRLRDLGVSRLLVPLLGAAEDETVATIENIGNDVIRKLA